ncbi:MAG: hypothetical protein AB8B36_13990 [Prochlorococcus sp.]
MINRSFTEAVETQSASDQAQWTAQNQEAFLNQNLWGGGSVPSADAAATGTNQASQGEAPIDPLTGEMVATEGTADGGEASTTAAATAQADADASTRRRGNAQINPLLLLPTAISKLIDLLTGKGLMGVADESQMKKWDQDRWES